MKSEPLAQILLNNRPDLSAHLEAQAAEMRAPRRNSDSDPDRPGPEVPRRLVAVAR